MTAYEVFERAYYHYTGQFMGHIWTANKVINNPKAYIEQSLNELLDEYSVDYAYNRGFKLSHSGNHVDKNVIDLRQIDAQVGYWLCHYNGHTGDWLVMWFESKPEAKTAYKKLYDRYFRHQDWFWIVKID